MTPSQIFIFASSIVVIALGISLYFWIQIRSMVSGKERTAASFYAFCFGLYVFGQSLVILQSLKYIHGGYDIPNYAYALAAILFAIGSYYQYMSRKK